MAHTVLIIDGDRSNRVQISNMLGKHFDIIHAHDVPTATKILMESDVHLVFLDQKNYNRHDNTLPHKSLPVILMTKSSTGSVRFTRIQ